MKKIINMILIFMIIFSFVGCDSAEPGRYEYYGKDTVEYFGNGRFVVFYPIDDDKKGPIIYLDNDGLFVVYEKESSDPNMAYELVNRKDKKIIDYIKNYKIFESCIYAIGKKGYTKINLLNDKEAFKQFDSLENFNYKDQIVFKVLDSEESNLEY